jgi:hypothetical protein
VTSTVPLTLTIAPSHAAVALLSQGKTLRVTVTMVYKPYTGTGSSAHQTITVRGHKPKT